MKFLFPREFILKKNRTIVGSQIRGLENVTRDPMTYKADDVDVWVDEDPNASMRGSSHAVTKFASDFFSKLKYP